MAGFIQYLKDTRGELKHVAWPTQRQTLIYTALVIGVSLLAAAYTGALDYAFTQTLEAGLGVETTDAGTFNITPVGHGGAPIRVEQVPLNGMAEEGGAIDFDITPVVE